MPVFLSYKTRLKTYSIIIGLTLLSLFPPLQAEETYKVGITPDKQFVDIKHKDTEVRIKRIQNENNKLTDSFTKTSRACPPFCISPMEAAPNVKTVGELEVIDFLEKEVSAGEGLLIDARLAEFYDVETIPGSVNIPFILFTGPAIKEVAALLSVELKDDKKDFSKAKKVFLFCNGPWCEQSPRAIRALIDFGYPADKIYYYRGGMQLWKLFSLTTVLPKPNKIEK